MHGGFYDLYMQPCCQQEDVLEADVDGKDKRSPRQARARAAAAPQPAPLPACSARKYQLPCWCVIAACMLAVRTELPSCTHLLPTLMSLTVAPRMHCSTTVVQVVHAWLRYLLQHHKVTTISTTGHSL